jgi:hypothetical protein
MKKLFLVLSLTIGLFFVSNANAQTPITFEKGKMSKTLTLTLTANSDKKFSIAVKKGQVVNILFDGDVQVSKKDQFIIVGAEWLNATDVDNTQDGEGYLSLFSGKKGTYIFSVGHTDKKRARTFKMKVTVSNKKDDFMGGYPE